MLNHELSGSEQQLVIDEKRGYAIMDPLHFKTQLKIIGQEDTHNLSFFSKLPSLFTVV